MTETREKSCLGEVPTPRVPQGEGERADVSDIGEDGTTAGAATAGRVQQGAPLETGRTTARRHFSLCGGNVDVNGRQLGKWGISRRRRHHRCPLNSLQHFSGADSGYMTSLADPERWRTHDWAARISVESYVGQIETFLPGIPPSLYLRILESSFGWIKFQNLIKVRMSVQNQINFSSIKNWKNGHSRLSLNEVSLDGLRRVPATPIPIPTVVSIPPPTLKQFKKWQKRQKKLLKKLSSIPTNIIPPHAPVTPLLPYSRAFSVDSLSSQVLDGYVDVPVTEKHKWKECRKMLKNQSYDDTAVAVSSGPPKLPFSSSCSNGFAVSDLRMVHSAPSTNTSDRSRLTSTTDHSSSLHHQTPSPVQLKKSSNQHLQRIRVSKNDVGLAGSPRRLQQWNLSKNVSNPTPSIVQHGNDDVVNEKTGSEVRKSDISQHLSDLNDAATRIVVISKYCHPKAATSQDRSERNHEFQNGTCASANRNNGCSAHSTNNGDSNSERIIPIKLTAEAGKVLENNDQLLSKIVANPIGDTKVFSTNETASIPFQQYNSISETVAQNQVTQQTQSGYFSLKKSGDCGSTISSLTQSSNMKTEVSDIDFSWVNDVENRLEREIAFVKEDSRQQQEREQQLPVRYFGVDLEQSEVGKGETAVVILPKYTTTTKSLEVFGECESRKELSQIHSDVRSKAAMFDTEAFRNERKIDEQAVYRYRSHSTTRDNVCIPQPDYRNYHPISVDIISQNSGRYEGSNMKLNGNVASVGIKCDSFYYDKCNTEKVPQQRQQYYSDYRNQMWQRNRTYGTTKYYVEDSTRCSTEKPWKAFVAY
uniref:Uncharacterized protein n=1 Tax=Setaria digitata TaxID=48799 RepID=A0A915PI88_9BILA